MGFQWGSLINNNTEYVDFSFNNKIFTNLDNISKYSQIVLVILIFLFLLKINCF